MIVVDLVPDLVASVEAVLLPLPAVLDPVGAVVGPGTISGG
jgi:hypothetical protein